ncbi:hypothetical protein LWI29_017423 [Acer saccharum]|uniref:Uncharacterized protein n=1 Tax=Acer saccharum TaxID=4024 RepID=A0AA39VRY3_ACESA|nr:hypothetical protein LWI29_017423 [Acer saccharum]
MGLQSKTRGKKRKRTDKGQSSAIGSDLEDAEAEFDFEGVGLESNEEDADYEAGSGSSKLDKILDVVQLLHTVMDFFEAKMRYQRHDTAEIIRHLDMPIF